MKKSKLSLGLIACLLSVGSLAGCDSNKVRSSNDGVLLSYTINGGKPVSIKADDILKEYYDDSTKYQAIFDAIYSVIKINYFNVIDETVTLSDGSKVHLGKDQMDAIKADAEDKVANDKKKATDNADANGTKYKTEFEAILTEQGVKTEEELLAKYIKDLQKERFDDNLYDYYTSEVRGEAGTKSITRKVNGVNYTFDWNGYLQEQSPYHVSHLMVEIGDSSDTNYSNGTITEENADSLYDVVSELASGEQKFSYLAYSKSDDSSSAEKSGDLGIMDYSAGTDFIDEFKLGIYAYEQMYLGVTPSYKGVESKIKIAADDQTEYRKQVKTLFNLANETDIPMVPMWVFEDLFKYKDKKSDENDKPVIEGAELVLPRNVLYNKYLNRHAVFFIDNGEVYDNDHPEAYSGYTDEKDNGNFHVVDFNGKKKVVLCADDDPAKPIVTVRGSSGGKQEIHFMVVNRSPFIEDANVSLDQYYTTYYYDQPLYPKGTDGKKLETYASFLGAETKDSQPRAEEVASKLKSFDSDKLTKYAFLKFMDLEKLEFTKESKGIEEALMKWIITSVEEKENEQKESWTKRWDKYLDKLARQNSERKKLVPEISIEFFDYANDSSLKLNDVVAFGDLNAEDLQEILNSAQIMDGVDISEELADSLFSKQYSELNAEQKAIVDDLNSPKVNNTQDDVAKRLFGLVYAEISSGNQTTVDNLIALRAPYLKDGNVTVEEIETYWKSTSVADAFKKEGGVFNDGKNHD